MIAKLRIAWSVASLAYAWLQQVQASAENRLSEDNARRDREWLEGVAKCLAEGLTEKLPKWLRPILKRMTLNNVFGRYMQVLLKSEKMKNSSACLYVDH